MNFGLVHAVGSVATPIIVDEGKRRHLMPVVCVPHFRAFLSRVDAKPCRTVGLDLEVVE